MPVIIALLIGSLAFEPLFGCANRLFQGAFGRLIGVRVRDVLVIGKILRGFQSCAQRVARQLFECIVQFAVFQLVEQCACGIDGALQLLPALFQCAVGSVAGASAAGVLLACGGVAVGVLP